MPLYPARNLNFINLKDYCKIDGSSDDSTNFTNAYTLASSLGMGLYMPGGTLVKGNDTLLSNVPIDLGGGTIKLKNGANTDLFSAQTGSINLSAAFGSGITGTLSNFSIKNGTLDGNKANQTSGTSYPLRFYGYKFLLRDLEIINGYSGPALIDWNGNLSESMEAVIDHVAFHDSNGIGLQMGGPHDSRLVNVTSFNNGSHNFHICPNATGILATNSHGYLNPNTAGIVDWLVEANGCQFVNCVAEGSYVCNLAIIATGCSWVGGNIYGPSNAVGIQLGQRSGQTPFPGQINQSAGVTTAIQASGCFILTMFSECRGGAISFQNEASNTILASVYQTVGTALVGPNSPLISSGDNYLIRVNGLTPDGSIGKSGGFQMTSSANNAWQLYDQAGNQVVLANPSAGKFLVGNGSATGGYIGGFSDAFFSTQQWSISNANGNIVTNGSLSTGQSATTPDPGAGGTINTANIGLARVTPASSRTGVILQAGTVAGQKCTVVNNSASFTITFATAATSNVAQGVSLVIAALGKYDFTWDSGAARWY